MKADGLLCFASLLTLSCRIYIRVADSHSASSGNLKLYPPTESIPISCGNVGCCIASRVYCLVAVSGTAIRDDDSVLLLELLVLCHSTCYDAKNIPASFV